MLPGEVDSESLTQVHKHVPLAAKYPNHRASLSIDISDAVGVSRRHKVISKLVFPNTIHVEPVERVFVISGFLQKMIGIVDVDVFGCAPFEDDIFSVDCDLLQHTIPYPTGIGVVRIGGFVECAPVR